MLSEIITTTENPWITCERQWLESRRSENTQRAYGQAVLDCLGFCGCDLQRLNRSNVLDWVASLKVRGLKKSTINARIAAISSFYQFAAEYLVDVDGKQMPLTGSNPAEMHGLRSKVKRYEKSRALSTAEVKQLLGSIDKTMQNGMRDYALILGFVILGRRNAEWRLARVLDFELQDGKIYYRWSGKGKENELLEVPEEFWKVLQEYLTATGGRNLLDYLFLDREGRHPISGTRMRMIVARYARISGIGAVRVHDLRHTAARMRREAGADVEYIRDFMAHSSLATTQHYLHRIERGRDTFGDTVCKMVI